MRILLSSAWFLLLSIVVVAAGCGGKPNRPPMGTVRGKVTYQGKPVSNATIAFLCDGASRMAIGRTDDNGDYKLTSYEDNDGAMVGLHVVTVLKSSGNGDPGVIEVPENYQASVESIDDVRRQSAKLASETKPAIPLKYADRNKTDLKREVVEGENVIDIELVD